MADPNTFFSPYPGILNQSTDNEGGFRDVLREVSDGSSKNLKDSADDARHQGNQFAAAQKDRADQDRYLAAAFERAQKDRADQSLYLQKDRTDKSEWDNERARDLAKDIERNGRSAELAVEKTAAATQLAFKDMTRDLLLQGERNAAAAAKCCCETEARIAASTAAILDAMTKRDADELRRQLTVYQIRSVPGTGSSPV